MMVKMYTKIFAFLLLTLFCAKTLGFGGVHGDHHSIGDSAHDYFHSVGQPHSHSEDNETDFEISYSDEAKAHVDASSEASTPAYLAYTAGASDKLNSSELIVSKTLSATSPFLKITPPPPKF